MLTKTEFYLTSLQITFCIIVHIIIVNTISHQLLQGRVVGLGGRVTATLSAEVLNTEIFTQQGGRLLPARVALFGNVWLRGDAFPISTFTRCFSTHLRPSGLKKPTRGIAKMDLPWFQKCLYKTRKKCKITNNEISSLHAPSPRPSLLCNSLSAFSNLRGWRAGGETTICVS